MAKVETKHMPTNTVKKHTHTQSISEPDNLTILTFFQVICLIHIEKLNMHIFYFGLEFSQKLIENIPLYVMFMFLACIITHGILLYTLMFDFKHINAKMIYVLLFCTNFIYCLCILMLSFISIQSQIIVQYIMTIVVK